MQHFEFLFLTFMFINFQFHLMMSSLSPSRSTRFLRGPLQHDALPVLRLQRRLQLRKQERQVILALHKRAHPHDAGR